MPDDFNALQATEIARVWFVEIREQNEDSLPQVQADCIESPFKPLQWLDGTLILTEPPSNDFEPDVADAELAEFMPADAGQAAQDIATSPLNECKLFVRYVIAYAGKGRERTREQWFAFKGDEGSFEQSYHDLQPNTAYDPDTDVPPFTIWLEQIRLSKAPSMAFKIAAGDRQIDLEMGDQKFEIPHADTIELVSSRGSTELVRKPLTFAAFLDDDGNPIGSNDVLIPAEEYGRIEFSTSIAATYHGQVPLVTFDAVTTNEKE